MKNRKGLQMEEPSDSNGTIKTQHNDKLLIRKFLGQATAVA